VTRPPGRRGGGGTRPDPKIDPKKTPPPDKKPVKPSKVAWSVVLFVAGLALIGSAGGAWLALRGAA
jgi:hypothetical protein